MDPQTEANKIIVAVDALLALKSGSDEATRAAAHQRKALIAVEMAMREVAAVNAHTTAFVQLQLAELYAAQWAMYFTSLADRAENWYMVPVAGISMPFRSSAPL